MTNAAEQLPNSTAASPAPHLFAEPRTLPELFRRAASEYDRLDALNYKADGEWRSISSSEFLTRSENVALGLLSLGLKPGDRAAILAANSPEWTIVDAGCQFAGIVDVPIYTTLAPEQVRYIIDDSGARVLFIDDDAKYQRVREAVKGCRSLEWVVLFRCEDLSDRELSLVQTEEAGDVIRASNP